MEEHQTHHEHSENQNAMHHAANSAPSNALDIPKFDFGKLDFGKAFNKFIEILKLNKQAMEEVSNDESLNAVALIFLVAASITSPLVMMIYFRYFTVMGVIGMLLYPVMMLVSLWVLTYVANNFFKGQLVFARLFRVIGLASLIEVAYLLAILSITLGGVVSLVAGIWLLVVMFKVLTGLFKLDAVNAVLSLIVTGVALMILMMVLGALGLGMVNPASYYPSRVMISY